MENDIATRNARAQDYLTTVNYRHIVRRDRAYDIAYPLVVGAAAVLMFWAFVRLVLP